MASYPIIKRRFVQVAITVLVFGLLAWWNPIKPFSPVRDGLEVLAWPVRSVFSHGAFWLRDMSELLSSIGELKSENERLSEKNATLETEIARLQNAERENRDLRAALELPQHPELVTRFAEVIGRDARGLGDFVSINGGSARGIAIGMPVLAESGSLIGRVDEVFPASARVMLLSNPESVVSAIGVRSGTAGAVRGEHSLGLLFDMALRSDPLEEGEEVVTSGLGGVFPKGLLIGRIEGVRASADRLFLQATIVPPLAYEQVRIVRVVTAQ